MKPIRRHWGRPLRQAVMALAVCLLAACGGGGGGDRAAGVEPGPEAPGGQVPLPPEVPEPSPAPYAEALELRAAITGATIPDDGQPVVDFQLANENNIAITDLTGDDVRFIIAKLRTSPLGNFTGNWQSYINRIEQAGSVGPGTEPKLQATTESSGELTNSGDGSYRYRFATDISTLPEDILAQAESEGLDLSVETGLTHRIAIQFGNSGGTANPVYDWVPASGATDGILHRDIAATSNCNRCHDKLALHGSGRVEIEYCVTCHNPGTTDANSGNTVDLKVMAHKIHRGANLPSVQAGGEYVIYGFGSRAHDYSLLHYPQDIRNCTNCHVGTGTIGDRDDLLLTAQGDNWNEYPSQAACGSCHDDLDFSRHAGGQEDDSRCASCHSSTGFVGSIADSHSIPVDEARAQFAAEVISVDGGAPGEAPTINFRVSNPQTGEDYDLLNDPVWTGSGASLNVRVAWDTGDYHNTGNGADDASSVAVSASGSTPNGDGSFRVTLGQPIPDASTAPGIAASGSGVAVVEGRAVIEDDEGESLRVPLDNAHGFFSIDEADGQATARRQSVAIGQCLVCHQSLSLHGDNRSNNIDSCVTCHNPRNTDREVRAIAATPPTDGKAEESLDFKTMIHGIHAAGIRENPLQIVGFRGFTTYVYDEDTVHYPGNIGNCRACHTESGFTLPLASTVLGSTVDTGDLHDDPRDDTVVTPTTAVCSSCHDDSVARAHMTANGGSFDTTQAALDNAEVVEQCSVCHGEGRTADVAEVHPVRELP
ncbi:OmcA/MtrC family decaheme c-type cytochrome [Parahaliea maris]|uniref:OmcA/MtrC family decaheme c-type cytochrome n=1 Tax=Parahaliea maris TaxID=2716870 RepID=A0A5C9A4D2_9GAMM|nr:OmcA/MtrC family decaheme c-type cytochrome [Parahaliea maris]TXS95586.1 OmcA/MtrC family decaheme c-type cytochrome [Parahaliea maris]